MPQWYWLRHLLELDASGELENDKETLGKVTRFLHDYFLRWLETVTLSPDLSGTLTQMVSLEDALRVSLEIPRESHGRDGMHLPGALMHSIPPVLHLNRKPCPSLTQKQSPLLSRTRRKTPIAPQERVSLAHLGPSGGKQRQQLARPRRPHRLGSLLQLQPRRAASRHCLGQPDRQDKRPAHRVPAHKPHGLCKLVHVVWFSNGSPPRIATMDAE